MTAKGPRIYLKELVFDDWKGLNSFASDPRVIQFQAWGPHTEKDSQDWVNLSIREQTRPDRKMFYWGVFLNESNNLIGDVGIHLSEQAISLGSAEIGYAIHPKY